MFTATDAGSHTFTNLFTLRTAGAQTITVTDGSINGSAPITVLPGGASILQLSSLPSSSRAGSSFDITVTAFDGYGNVATGYQGTVTFSSSDGGAILPANYPFSAADAGIHRFASGGTLITAGIQSLAVADVAGGITGATANVTVTPAPAALFMLTAPGTVIPGVPFDITVAALDPYGNVDVNYLGTIAFASSDPDPGVLLPPNYSFQPTDLGMAIFPGGGTLITLGQQTISATDVNSGITGSVSVLVSGGDQPNPGRRLRIPGTSLDVVQRTRQTRAIRTATPPVATAIEAAGSMGGAAEGRLPEIVRQLGPLVEPDMPDPLADGWLI